MAGIQILVDIGSTFTKCVAVDILRAQILATAKSATTVQEDVTLGLEGALRAIEQQIGSIRGERITACSSAAGGLRMVAVGLVPELSAEAASRAALGAGAKIIGFYSYKLGRREIEEIERTSPDIVLLAGGTDGGNEAAIVHNAGMISRSQLTSPIVVAGNKCAYDRIEELLAGSARRLKFVDNVMPEIGRLEVASCREAIREVFMENIVKAKGLEKAVDMTGTPIIPTPVAVLNAAILLNTGAEGEQGLGEIIAVDVGGATTDIYSIAQGTSTRGAAFLKGLPEPFAKRTVEGDLGVRHNIDTLLAKCNGNGIVLDEDVVSCFRSDPSLLPRNEQEMAVDSELARVAVKTSFERHVGTLETVYGPHGEMLVQVGKDLSNVTAVIGTGGPIANASSPRRILSAILAEPGQENLLKPKEAAFHLDREYVMYAAGLLAQSQPKAALRILKQSLQPI